MSAVADDLLFTSDHASLGSRFGPGGRRVWLNPRTARKSLLYTSSRAMDRLPVRLERPPLIEAVFELRFAPRSGFSIELLPGLIFPALKDRYPLLEQTPTGSIPRDLRQQH